MNEYINILNYNILWYHSITVYPLPLRRNELDCIIQFNHRLMGGDAVLVMRHNNEIQIFHCRRLER